MKPRFVDDMKNITVELGQDATFVCAVSEILVSHKLLVSFEYILCSKVSFTIVTYCSSFLHIYEHFPHT